MRKLEFHPNRLVLGEPGSGKSVGTASLALAFPGAIVCADPQSESISSLLLEHSDGEVIFHRLDDLDHPVGYDLLRSAPTHLSPGARLQVNRRRARQFVETIMRRRGGDIAGSPLMEEWVMAMLMLYLYQGKPKDPGILPYAFRPGTAEFRALLRDCSSEETRDKFETLTELKPRSLRTEVGSAARLIEPVFSSPEFLAACRPGLNVGAALQRKIKLLIERGTADEDVTRTIIGGLSLVVTEHCEGRLEPWPPVAVILEECTNARTAGPFEERKAGETRKYGQHWWFIAQHPNFPNGPEGFFQNCQEKHFYRTGDFTLARKLASFGVGATGRSGESRAEALDRVTTELMTFQPGERYVVGPGGVRRDRVEMLVSGWPDWPGLREAKKREIIEWSYRHPERRSVAIPSGGGASATASASSSAATPPPSSRSPADSSAVLEWLRRRRQAGTSRGSGNAGR
jgi:hypothetical protein